MSQQRPFHMVGIGGAGGNNFNDTTYTKLFVGGLAWETQRDTMKRYFEQFGEILEAVVITDKSTGRSKGYGFVTFKDAASAYRACQNPSPVIDGRRANCNLACLGAQKNRPSIPQHAVSGEGRYRGAPSLMSPPTYASSSSSTPFFPQASPQVPTFPYSTYGYGGYAHDTMYHMNYYGMYGQHLSAYYTSGGGRGTGTGGYMGNYYPYYTMQLQSNQTTPTTPNVGFGLQFGPHMQQQHYSTVGVTLPQQLITSTTTAGLLSLPITSSMPFTTPSNNATAPGVTTSVGVTVGPSKTPTSGAVSEQKSSD